MLSSNPQRNGGRGIKLLFPTQPVICKWELEGGSPICLNFPTGTKMEDLPPPPQAGRFEGFNLKTPAPGQPCNFILTTTTSTYRAGLVNSPTLQRTKQVKKARPAPTEGGMAKGGSSFPEGIP